MVDNDTFSTDDNYQIIEGSAQTPTEPIVELNTYVIKNIEISKQITNDINDIAIIITAEINGKTIKVSLQNNTKQNSSQNGFNNDIIIKINDSDITYYTLSINSEIMPSGSVETQELNETNSAVLNNRTPENIAQLLNAIKVQLNKIYEQQMQVAKEIQEQEDMQNGITPANPNSPETNTIVNYENVIQ